MTDAAKQSPPASRTILLRLERERQDRQWRNRPPTPFDTVDDFPALIDAVNAVAKEARP